METLNGRQRGAALCSTGGVTHAVLTDARGSILEVTPLEGPPAGREGSVCAFLDRAAERYELGAIGVGVPGVVDRGGFSIKRPDSGLLQRTEVAEGLERRYGVPVVLENDMNATAIGFARCYAREFPGEDPERVSMAYLHFDPHCVSAGLIVEGRILRGWGNFAGELGLVPVGGDKTLDQWMEEPMEDALYIDRMVQVLGWLCGVVNPQYVALGGPALRRDCIGPIGDGLSAFLPGDMAAEVLYAEDVWHDYHDGMAFLTAQRMGGEGCACTR